ncbi:MAG: redox-regulated ATPase YchF [Bacteroidetes bacterium]|nr:redox-regulated ATPase YchF [Bacteroidota bacterium]
MALKCGIVGLTNVGKTTLFNCMSSSKAQASSFAFSTNKSNMGMAEVPDQRLNDLASLVNPAKIIPATVELVDIPGLAKGSSAGEGVGNAFLADIRLTDALIHVLRCFDDPALPHVEGSVDPVRDIEILEFELQVKDMESVEKKISRLEKTARHGDRDALRGIDVLQKCKAGLEDFKGIRSLNLSEEEKKEISDLCLLTQKPVIYVCNVDVESAVSGNAYTERVKEALKDAETEVLIIAGAMEAEIAELDDAEDQLAFLADIGLSEPGVNKLIRAAFSALNLMTFLTAGPKEVRAWTIRKGMTAPEAAGTIHSDLQRGFIRSEVIRFDDYMHYKTEQACKEAGKLRVEGKSYVVADGDVLHIRFNV